MQRGYITHKLTRLTLWKQNLKFQHR